MKGAQHGAAQAHYYDGSLKALTVTATKSNDVKQKLNVYPIYTTQQQNQNTVLLFHLFFSAIGHSQLISDSKMATSYFISHLLATLRLI
jgi:hypothetical protein